ncbi:unnamed protein product [Rhodiola kirilowii]
MKDANSADKMPNVQLEAAINQDAIVRITQASCEQSCLRQNIFQGSEINRIFEWFANHWMKLKEDAKIKEAFESQEYKFRPRTLKTDTIFEFDESILNIFSSVKLFKNGKILSLKMRLRKWYLLRTHGAFTVPESESMESFIESYSLGVGIVDGLGGLSSSNLDAKLAPEHMLRLSLDLNQNIELSHKGNQAYNFYKDPNTSAVAKMVEIVAALQHRIVSLPRSGWITLNPALTRKWFQVPLSDHIKRITDLASTWKKMEFESWPFLINEVQAECDSNAAKLRGVCSYVKYRRVQKASPSSPRFPCPDKSRLCKWEHPESYLCMANTKRVRQKLKKLIQKYTSSSVATVHTDIICKNKSVIDTPLNLDEFDESRYSTVVEGGLTSQAGHVVYPEELNSVWSILKKLFSTAKGCNQLWNDMNTTLGKRRALSEFLKLLESCGLSRHKSAYYEDQHKSNLCSQWFLQPSYDTNHLLMKQNDKHSENTSSDKAKVLPAEGLVDEWKTAKQVRRSVSYLDHFIMIQQEQRASAYAFSKQDLESVVEKNFLTLTMLEESVLTFRENLEQRVAVEDIMLSHFDDIFKEKKSCSESYSELYAKFHGSFKKSLELAAATTLALGYSQNEDHLSEEFLCSIPSWTALFDSYTNKLQLEGLCDNLFKTIGYAGELVKHHENDCTSLTFELGKNLNMLEQCALYLFFSRIFFSSLYSTGFGNSEKQEDGCDDTSQDAKGTGMGEGVGAKDVSDQLTDEDQLLQKEEQDGANEDPGKNDKGIEMEEDFEADTFSVSEDSGEDEKDDNDDDDEQLESAMGDAGTESAVVDQKSWDKSKDEKPESNEKYETGSSMKDQNGDDRELRGKEDSEDTLPNDFDPAEGNENDGEAGEDGENGDDLEENENMEDANMDKDEAFAEPTGLDIVENNQEQHESMDLDPQEDGTDEAENAEEGAESAEGLEENLDETDVTLDEGEQEQLDENSEMDNIEKGKEDDSNMDVDVNGQDASDTQSTRQPKVDLQAIGSNYAPEVNWSNSSDIQNNPTSAEGLPGTDASENEVMMADASNKGRPTNDKSDTQEWKERAKVSIDVGEGDKDGLDDMVEDDPDEYGYVPESETGTAQALGAATSDQDENVSEMDSEQKNAETNPVQNGAMVQRNKMEEPAQNLPLEDPAKEQVPEEPNEGEDSEGLSNSLVSVKRSFMSSGIGKLNELSLSDDEPLEGTQPEIITNDMKDDASKKWRSYELRTTRLSQELAEQLRLVMEPTLASKLQGDYKTGKRINMKKVIPYIASQYRKDKIWLRRTRPNKRDYQVVIAVDDPEALVTVCRAMSQLEVGSLAVTSFGKKGNVKLLHDFDQPFSGEAGVKKKLRRIVRDAMSRRRLIAFLLVDSPEESIMDLMEVSFEKEGSPSGGMKMSKYLDSFPFPYYIVLKDMDSLPRTLADLMRQWFELMQQSGE